MGAKQSFPLVELQKGRTFIITGANRGIGYEATKRIATMGGTVIMACRSETDCMKAMEQMNKEYKEEKERGATGIVDMPELDLVFMPLDLSSLLSTKDFVREFKESGRPLHVIICNAGVSKAKPEQTADGYDYMLQVNYLSHFLLVGLLLPELKKTKPDEDIRIIFNSAEAHKLVKFDVDALNYVWVPDTFTPLDFYGRSKLYQVMQMYSLQRRLRGTHITINCGHPGTVETNIIREFNDSKMFQVVWNVQRVLGIVRSPEEGASTLVDMAINPAHRGVSGQYYKDCKPASTSATARDETKQEMLWNRTIEYLKEHFAQEEIYCLEGADPS